MASRAGAAVIRIAIVDDHPVVRAGLRGFFAAADDIDVVAEGADGRAALAIVRGGGVDVLTLDFTMPGQNGVDALAAIRARAPTLPVLMLSGLPEAQVATMLLRLGASGYLGKDSDPAEILCAVRTVAAGRRYISTATAQCLAAALADGAAGAPHEQLSERELQVFLHLAQGEALGLAAGRLCLSVKTVSTYRSRVMEKMHLASNSDLTYYALKHGLIR